MDSEFKTTNFYLKYKYINYNTKLNLNTEIYRCQLYNLFIKYHIDKCKKYNFIINKKNNKKNENILTEILSMFIFFKEDTDDVFFSNKPNYDINLILQYIIRYTKKVKTYKKILVKMEKKSKKLFDELNKNDIIDDKYKIISNIQDNKFVIIACILNISDSESKSTISSYKIKYPLYSHLFKLFIHNNKINLNFDNISIDDFLHKYFNDFSNIDENTKNIVNNINLYIFVLFNRYNCIYSGGNQA